MDKMDKLSYRLIQNYPECVPVIIRKNVNEQILQDIDKERYLIPKNLSVSDLLFIIRKKLKINSEIFIFVNNLLMSMDITIGSIYNAYKNENGFLYLTYNI